MSYLSRAVIDEEFGNPPARHSDRTAEGRQNPTIFATYGFINDKTSPLSLIGELAATTNTTGKEHSVYTGSVAAGWKTSNTLRLYSAFSTSMSSDSGTPTFNSVNIGAYKALSESLTLIPHAAYGRVNSTDTFSAVRSFNIGLAGNIRLAPNSYLTPAINFYKNGSANSKDGFFHQNKTGNNRTLSVGFYHLF